ncbi:MAG: NADH-quinone oxidoreductase subunit C [Acidobacteriota bacterium]
MSDDKPITPPEPTPPSEEEKAPEKTAGTAETPAPTADDAGKAATGATEKKSEEEAPPKDPWEEKPVPPQHEEAVDDPDAMALEGEIPGVVVASDRFAGEVTLTVPAARIVDVCRFLKHDCDYKFLVDLTAVDWPEREEGRFDVIYWLHRHDDSKRLRLRAVLAEENPIDSVTAVWKVANWMEREAYDLFGIRFDGHPGLERILTWEGFNGHPLRKDFPVEGIDTGAAIYPDVYPPGGGPPPEEEVDEKGGAE